MKDIQETLRRKEQDMRRLEKEVDILRAAMAILNDADQPQEMPSPNRGMNVAPRPTDMVDQIIQSEVMAAPKRAFP
jgi:hypothetical protein